MSVYKYDENTQTMREYDVAYQVQGQDCPEIPNTLDLINTYEKGLKTRIDSSWLPLLKAVDGEIRIGTADGYPNTSIWSAASEIFLESTEVPVTVYGRFPGAEQVYIYNQAQWGILTNIGNYSYQSNTRRVFIRDDQATREVGNDSVPHQTKDLYVGWVPNATACFQAVDAYGGSCKQLVICAKNIRMWYGDWDAAKNQILYHNDDVVFESRSDENYKGTLVPFAKAETEWLDNYFNIEQDGQTIEWYEDTISNEYGKFIRLKKNNTKVAELMYWKDGKIEEEIGLNLTDTAITRTGSITVGDVTKTYSITQKPMARTVKARMYFNPVEQDGKNFNNFCVWPLSANFGVNDGNWNQTLQYFIKIRYKAVGDTTWTDMTLPTVQELKQKSNQVAGHEGVQIIDLYTVEINTAGYYDVEWTFYPDELYSLMSQWDEYENRWIFSDRKMWYDYTNQTYEVKENEDMYLENTPFVVSIDYGKQYVTDGIGKHSYVDNFNIRDWDDNPRMETLSIGPCNAQPDRNLFGGMMGRGLKYLVYNNIQRGNGHYDWVGCENWDDVFSNEGILFYVIPERQKFDNWFLGCSANPHIVYLHPDIYALSDHGFNGEVNGWDQSKYQEAGSPELRELPSNWKTLVPNYIGE